ncbi:MAG: GYD domain-containing protein [Paracoccaceae bacterium]|nr:GYD domain-containing protein [Paracoccaceae bacterium]
MPIFIVTASYSQDTVKGLMTHAQGRRAAVGKLVEKGGGTLLDMYMTTGPHDVMAIVEMPDGGDVVAVNMAIAASGAAVHLNTIRAWSPEEFEGIAKKATEISGAYSPPGT